MPVLPNGQILPYTKSGQTSPGYQGPYLQSLHLGPDGQLYPWMPPLQPGELVGQLGQPQAPNIPRAAGVGGAPGPMAGTQMGPGGIFGGNRMGADMELRRRAAMGMGQGYGMPVWRAPARMTGNPMGTPAPAAGATMQRQIPAGMVPQVQAYAAQRTQQPGGQRLTGMQQGMSSGMPSQNLQGVQTGAQDYVTNRRRGILGGAL